MKATAAVAICALSLSACAGTTSYVQQNVTQHTPQPYGPEVIVPDGYFLSASGSLCKRQGISIACRRNGETITVRDLGTSS